MNEPSPFDLSRSIDLPAACRLFFRRSGGRHGSAAVARRWVTVGRRVAGVVVKLPARKDGHVWYTMPEWCQWFLRRCDRAATAPPSVGSPPVETARQATARRGRAVERMRARGFQLAALPVVGGGELASERR